MWILSFLLLLNSELFAAKDVTVIGWPIRELEGETPPIALGDDAVYGRQACPALTRLNLREKKSEPLVIRSVQTSDSQKTWEYELRSGIFWWSGHEVTPADIKSYIETSLSSVVKERSGGVWEVPAFNVKVKDHHVTVTFKEEPSFGPYIFNGVPLSRPVKGTQQPKFECVGWYRIAMSGERLTLRPTSHYVKQKELPTLAFLPTKSAKITGSKMEFSYASARAAIPSKRSPETPPVCERGLDLPYSLMIAWNLNAYPLNNLAFRRSLDKLIPRASLASGGAALLAVASSGLVPHNHPGYLPTDSLAEFDIKGAASELAKAGFERKGADGPRTDQHGKPLALKIKSQVGSSGLIEKVLQDVFSAVGISIVFVPDSTKPDDVHGTLGAYDLDWPRVSLIANFHSKSSGLYPFNLIKDENLDQWLDEYARSITQLTPRLETLGKIQKRISEIIPVTVLLQQRACFDISGGFNLPKGEVNTLNPDWFREILM